MRVLLFGTGKLYHTFKKCFAQYEIVYLLDNDKNKQGTYLDGIKIVSPTEVTNVDYGAIFILSVYSDEMKIQLLSIGVDEDKIFTYQDVRVGMENIDIYGERTHLRATGQEKRILLITHNLNITGAEVVLLSAAKIFKNKGFEVVVAGQEDGLMRNAFVEEDIPVIIDPGLSVFRLTSLSWIKKFKPNIVLVNTIFMHHLFRCRKLELPVIWWLHDSEALYRWVQCDGLNEYYHDNIQIYAVSKLAQDPFVERFPNWPVKLLPYGVKDIERYTIKQDAYNGKIIFATIGSIEERKAQDVLFNAINILPYEERIKCEFWLIYQPVVQSNYADMILKESSSMPEVRMVGQIKHEEIGEVYRKISALICPSNSDTLPTVTVEAMQSGLPCIVSDGTGTADYIEDYKNGFVFPAGKAELLAEKIVWMIHNKNKLLSMGKEARKTYDTYFTMEVFEKNLMEALRKAGV